MHRHEKKPQAHKKKYRQKPLLEDELELVPQDFIIVDELAFRSDTRKPKGLDGPFATGLRRKAISWETYSEGHSLILIRPIKLKNGSLMANVPTDEMIENNKIYLYLTNFGPVVAVKNIKGEIIRTAIDKRMFDFNTANHLLQALQDPEGNISLSLADEKAIFKALGYKRHALEPTYRKKQTVNLGMKIPLNDIDPPTAVSVTKIFDCAPIFPVGKEYENKTKIWIYVVGVHSAFLTYQEQLKNNSESVFCMEMAVRDIPAGDIICAIKCKRYWTPNILNKPTRFNFKDGMYYQIIGDIVWNPKLENVKNYPSYQKYKQYIINLIEERKNKFIVCPIHLDLTKNEKENILNGTYPSSLTIEVMTEEEHSKNELFRAIYTDDFETVGNLLKSESNINNINKQDARSKLYPIHLAVLQKNIEIVKLLVKYGADINQGEGQGNLSALDMAISNNNEEIAMYLISQEKVDINRLDKDGVSPLYRAIYMKSPSLVKALLEAGAQITEDVLKIANKKKNNAIISLLNQVIRIQLEDDLLKTVIKNDIAMIKQLVHQGASINHLYFNERESNDLTLLDLAVHNNQFNVVLTLLDLGSTTCTYPLSRSVILLHQLLKDNPLLQTIKNDFSKIALTLELNQEIISNEKQDLILDLINFTSRPTLDVVKFCIAKKLLIGLIANTNYADIEFTNNELRTIQQCMKDKSYLSKLITQYGSLGYESTPSVDASLEKKNVF